MALAERYRAAKDLNLDFEYYTQSLNKMMKQTSQQLKILQTNILIIMK